MSAAHVTLAPQQLRIDEVPCTNSYGDPDIRYKVVHAVLELPVCSHTTYVSAFKCKMGVCPKGHNYHL